MTKGLTALSVAAAMVLAGCSTVADPDAVGRGGSEVAV